MIEMQKPPLQETHGITSTRELQRHLLDAVKVIKAMEDNSTSQQLLTSNMLLALRAHETALESHKMAASTMMETISTLQNEVKLTVKNMEDERLAHKDRLDGAERALAAYHAQQHETAMLLRYMSQFAPQNHQQARAPWTHAHIGGVGIASHHPFEAQHAPPQQGYSLHHQNEALYPQMSSTHPTMYPSSIPYPYMAGQNGHAHQTRHAQQHGQAPGQLPHPGEDASNMQTHTTFHSSNEDQMNMPSNQHMAPGIRNNTTKRKHEDVLDLENNEDKDERLPCLHSDCSRIFKNKNLLCMHGLATQGGSLGESVRWTSHLDASNWEYTIGQPLSMDLEMTITQPDNSLITSNVLASLAKSIKKHLIIAIKNHNVDTSAFEKYSGGKEFNPNSKYAVDRFLNMDQVNIAFHGNSFKPTTKLSFYFFSAQVMLMHAYSITMITSIHSQIN